MFIKALCEYYDYLAEQGEVQEPGFEQTPIHYLIMLKPSGEIADIVDVQVEVKIPNAWWTPIFWIPKLSAYRKDAQS